MSVFIAMCQVNIALGILYLGLPESRYREKLIETILARLTDSGCDDMDVVSADYTRLTTTDETFSNHHHYILDWIGEVPTDKLKGRWADLLDSQQYRGPTWIKRDRRYWWYKHGVDKWLTLFVLVILPILGMWLSEFYSSFAGESSMVSWMVLGIGQLSIAMHVIIGRRMATRIGGQISRKSEYVSRKFYESSAKSRADDVSKSQPPK